MNTMTVSLHKCSRGLGVLVCSLLGALPAASGTEEGERLEFSLRDANGRKVEAADYAGTPVLILSGACWCGGCQQDAEPLRELIEKYGPRGLQFIRSVCGEGELAALEFQKHYRLSAVHLLDVNREFERQYHRNGWPFVMLVDRAGNVVFKANDLLERETPKLVPLIGEVLAEPVEAKTVTRDGVRYLPTTLERNGEQRGPATRDSFPSIACGADGRVVVAFSSNRGGANDVFLRVFDGQRWLADQPVAATVADEFDAVVAVNHDGRTWLTWTSNADGSNYNVFVSSFIDPLDIADPRQLTHAPDDAMHARLACDRAGNVWVTYYKWHKLGQYSRDKEVYVQRFDGKDWSDEVRVSPPDVPDYEDHSEPTVAAYGDGVVVCWSWDFHRPAGYTRDSRDPTVFLRTLGADLELGEVRAISRKHIDTAPTVAVDAANHVWCAWDSLVWEQKLGASRKGLYVCPSDLTTRGQRPDPFPLESSLVNVCTPRLAVSPQGTVTLVWGQCREGERWCLQRAAFDSRNNRWSDAETIVSEGNPRFPSVAYDRAGHLWVAFTTQHGRGRRIMVRTLP
ncbi:MAG TPA: TlpA disulfide reductase family protein [Phycisphaerae bacterium]|nr:TlpA disulfide reductase family protein [Phycisphaerae bacterium]